MKNKLSFAFDTSVKKTSILEKIAKANEPPPLTETEALCESLKPVVKEQSVEKQKTMIKKDLTK